jgi:fluoroacetyl-CoA thioesterase
VPDLSVLLGHGLALSLRLAVKTSAVPAHTGDRGHASVTVTAAHTAHALGVRGVEVFATPFLVALMEEAGGAVMTPHLPPGGGSVGTMVEVKHLAATPVGMTVRAEATLLETDGKRFLFSVEAWDEKEKIGEGRHERFVVADLAKFVARVAKKKEP